MINLIPREERKRMLKDFRYRLLVLFLVVLSAGILIGIIAILPAYFISGAKVNFINAKIEIQNEEPLSVKGEQALSAIKNINEEIAIVESAEKRKFLPSASVVNAILIKKRLDIKITKITYENEAIGGKKISITGTAPSRAVLLLFRQSLEDSAAFKSVDLPISNFVKGSNIEFSLSLVPA